MITLYDINLTMGRSISIFCQDEEKISLEEIIEFINDGIYFDEEPEFNIYDNCLIIQYDLNFKPIVIREINDPKIVKDIIEETYEEISEMSDLTPIYDEATKSMILTAIMASKNIYNIEFSFDDLSEDCWAIKACVESFLATEKNGIILADEGIYNSDIKLIMNF